MAGMNVTMESAWTGIGTAKLGLFGNQHFNQCTFFLQFDPILNDRRYLLAHLLLLILSQLAEPLCCFSDN